MRAGRMRRDRSRIGRRVGLDCDLGGHRELGDPHCGRESEHGRRRTILRINALGTVRVNEAFFSLAKEGFAIVNVASMAAHVFPSLLILTWRFNDALRNEDRFMAKLTAACNIMPNRVRPGFAYAISKNFVTWYTASQAARFGSRGPRLVSVSPGSIDTDMGMLEERAGQERWWELAALKRFGRPEEVAEVLAFCASTKAGYLTGVDIPCDGGVLAGFRLKDMLTVASDA